MFFFNDNAQGTVEYLIIIAVVVVLSLIVVGIVITQVDNSQQVSASSGKLGLWTNSVSVTETAVSSDGNFFVKLLNNTGDFITVSNVSVGDVNVYFSESLAQGSSRGFVVESNDVCSLGSNVTSNLVVSYVTKDGLSKTEKYPVKIGFDCVNYQVTQAMLANSCVSQATSVEPNLLAQNISSEVSLFGVSGYLGLHSGQQKCAKWSGTTWVIAVTCGDVNVPLNQDANVDSSRNLFLASRFVASILSDGNKVVRDTWNGLMWQDSSPSITMDWNSAMSYCNTFGGGGFSNWRLATVAEAYSIFDYGSHYDGVGVGSACVSQFTNCFGNWVWTSSSVLWSPTYAYYYYPYYGAIYGNSKTNTFYARCVRSEN